ncbi:hypothetical protein [Caenimonas soli]|jgi:hypothetical protein|uniref:hypothetical protein n=1 Tax=Caenimonas soli TaxID=2735555 RepID=UPI001555B86F|nr:hypothetical protein [Caenimonas soli]NPC54727.1 hypothetical protein [Caenimonas soli]
MLPHLLAKSAQTSPGKLFWSVIVALMLGQIVAFWMLCSHQVRKAQVRDATLQVERMAMSDCLRYIPKSTLNSCASRVVQNREPGPALAAGGAPAASPAKPVKVAFQGAAAQGMKRE